MAHFVQMSPLLRARFGVNVVRLPAVIERAPR